MNFQDAVIKGGTDFVFFNIIYIKLPDEFAIAAFLPDEFVFFIFAFFRLVAFCTDGQLIIVDINGNVLFEKPGSSASTR